MVKKSQYLVNKVCEYLRKPLQTALSKVYRPIWAHFAKLLCQLNILIICTDIFKIVLLNIFLAFITNNG